MRADAIANRERVLSAAAEVFAEHGLDAGVEEIARVAGVGMGTVYRRFPTKEALISELVREMLDTLLGLAQAALAVPDGGGLEHYLEAASTYQAAHRGCLPRLWTVDEERPAVARLRAAVAELLTAAQAAGQAREDLTPTDLTMIMWSIRGVIETTRDVAPDAWRRYLDIVVAGLRPAAQPLRHGAMTRVQVDRVLRGS